MHTVSFHAASGISASSARAVCTTSRPMSSFFSRCATGRSGEHGRMLREKRIRL